MSQWALLEESSDSLESFTPRLSQMRILGTKRGSAVSGYATNTADGVNPLFSQTGAHIEYANEIKIPRCTTRL